MTLDPPPSATAARPIVIIGAGFAGLAAAVRLVAGGRRVVVIEATKSGGGRSRSFPYRPDGGRDGGTHQAPHPAWADPGLELELDNGQHLMMGCYRETRALLRTIGAENGVAFQRNLALDMVRQGGQVVALRCPALPAPLHLAGGLLGMRGLGPLGPVHKLAALRLGLLLRQEVERPDDRETCDAWLRRLGQTETMRQVFWDPLIWAVLNDDPLVCSAAMLVAVLERAFLGTRDESVLGVPRRPLSRLYVKPARAWLRERGAALEFGDAARTIEWLPSSSADGAGASPRIEVTTRSGRRWAADDVVCAVPPHALLELLPERLLRHPVLQDVARLRTSPIVNVWALVDRSPLRGELAGLVGSPFHWLFDRGRIEGLELGGATVLNGTISGARAFVEDSPAALVRTLEAELARYFPGRPVRVWDAKVVKERRATISHAAGTSTLRPDVRGPAPGLWLAGDWVRTGLPATIESACQSGHDVARALLAD